MANTPRQNKRKQFAQDYEPMFGKNNEISKWAYKVNRRTDKRKRAQFRRAKEEPNA